MSVLLKNGNVINLFSNEILQTNLLIDGAKIVGVGDYADADADTVVDLSGKYISPGLIDGHIHIESTMLTPYELSKVCVKRGTTAIICDPHEIANICGADGINYMMQASEGLPMAVYFTLPSCVPATPFDEAGATLTSQDLSGFYSESKVVALGEVMNYTGVINGDIEVLLKIMDGAMYGKVINGHAPLLSGKDLDKYILEGIRDDHECTNFDEAIEKLRKGQAIMIREGSASKNLDALLPLFDEKYANRCMIVSDDKHPQDLIENGHLDNALRRAVKAGKDAITAIKMATLVPATHYHLKNSGAIAPGYYADLVIFDDLKDFNINKVYYRGDLIVDGEKTFISPPPRVSSALKDKVKSSVNLSPLTKENFIVAPCDKKARIIKLIKNSLLTEEVSQKLDFTHANGVSTKDDILKIAVVERHHATSHIGLGFVQGVGLKQGAIASTVSHDSHNLIVIGQNEEDMATACNEIIKMQGGMVAVKNGEVLAALPLPIAGLMTELSAEETAKLHEKITESAYALGIEREATPFMSMAFLSLPVIPRLKLTTLGLVDVNKWQIVDLFIED